MKFSRRTLLACLPLPLLVLAACGGGGDATDRLDVTDPVVRFIDVSPTAPNLTLFKDTTAQSDATNVGYQFASNYFDINMGSSVWSTKSADGTATLGSNTIDPQRGTKYTIVALNTSATTTGTILIVDPFNRPLTTSSSYLRLVNASYAAAAASVDLYMTPIGFDITQATPIIRGAGFDKAAPDSGGDSVPLAPGTYQATVTTAGTTTVLFKGQVMVGTNQDVLLLTVPSATPSGVAALVKVEGTAGATPLPAL